MPTFDRTDQFRRDHGTLTPAEKKTFRRAVEKFIEDVPGGKFRKGLRVKHVEGTEGVFEMTWEKKNGRATWEYGEEVVEGEVHIVWRRIGGHEIFSRP